VKRERRGREEKVGKRKEWSRGGKGCVMAVGGIDAPATKYIIGHIKDEFLGSNDPTNSVKALKKDRS